MTSENRPGITNDIKIARSVGKIVGTADFGLRQLGALLPALNILNPLSTNTFTISDHFKGRDRKVIEEAVRASKMPEGVKIIGQSENPPTDAPSVVVSAAPDAEKTKALLKAGASDVVTLTYNVKTMTNVFNEAFS